ncbi:hypothetical protein ACWEQC_19590 [Streptomyces shenzhenensis]
MSGRDPVTAEAVAARLRDDGFGAADRVAAHGAVTGPGDIDVPVDTVGRRDRRGGEEMTPEELEAMLGVRLTSAYALSRIVARGHGHGGRRGHAPSPARRPRRGC